MVNKINNDVKSQIQRLLKEKAELQAKINISAFNGSVEIKTVNNEKYIYVRKREAGRYKSTYINKYSEELYTVAVNQSQQIRPFLMLPNIAVYAAVLNGWTG